MSRRLVIDSFLSGSFLQRMHLATLLTTMVVAFSGTAAAGMVTLGVTQDTRLQNGVNAPDPSSAFLSVYSVDSNIQRSLLQFNLSPIPPGQQILSAVLKLTANVQYGSNPDKHAMTAHQVTKEWNETQATWSNATTGNGWSSPGGDYHLTAAASSNANPTADQIVSWNLTSLVQDWYDGSAVNYGLLLKSLPGNQLHFHSSNVDTQNWRPALEITYAELPSSEVPEPSTLALFAMGGIGCLARRTKRS